MKLPATRMARRAQVQYGLITLQQAEDCGVSAFALGRMVRAGRLERPHPGVYRIAGVPRTPDQALLAAVLAARGVASHRAAARLWGLGDWGEVELTVERPRHPRLVGAIVHRSMDLDWKYVTRRRGVVVTNPMRTLVDLGAVDEVKDHHVADALERALLTRVTSIVAIERVLDDVARRGRAGAGVIRRVLDERALGRARPDGLLEARMARVLREHGLPSPHFQFYVRHRGRFVARVDFAYPDLRLALEVDGFEVHGTPKALQHDLERQNRLVAAGWTVLRFTWLDVVQRPEWVAAQVAQVASALRGRAIA